jgi:Tfp pilus assembly protein PilX
MTCGKTFRERWSTLAQIDVCQNEDGVALILVMVMLVMLTFIGLAALSTSSTELFLSANYRRSREAFQAADGMMESALIDGANFIPPAGGPGTTSNLVNATLTNTNSSNNTVVTATGHVTYTGTGAAPAGSGTSAKMNGFKANYFIVDTKGTGSFNATSRQELVTMRLVPGGT